MTRKGLLGQLHQLISKGTLMPKITPPPLKKRGAQPGKRGGQPHNTNALKHGIYSQRLAALAPAELTGFSTDHTTDEIQVIRVMIARHLKMRKEHPPQSSEETLTDLRVISFAVGRLASLMRLQRNLPAEDNIPYSENWLEELLNDLDSDHDYPHDSTDLLQ